MGVAYQADGVFPEKAAAATVVRDYTALISGATVHDLTGTGAFYSFSFPTALPGEYAEDYDSVGLSTFRALSDAEKAVAREAIAAFGAASGLTFFEVAPAEGDIRFSVFDLDVLTPDDEAAFAYYPTGTYDLPIASDVFVDRNYADSLHIMLHEIGHALGLKHPFDDDVTLASDLDNYRYTVMSYTSGGFAGDELGPLDLDALHHLYGDDSIDGDQIAAWSWNAATLTLSQTGNATAETINGIGGSDIIQGGDGNDVISGRGGRDRLFGEGGNDLLWGDTGDDALDGGAGADQVEGLDGNDALNGGVGNDYVAGSSGHDRLLGAAGDDRLFGGVGDDTLYGGDGRDQIDGGLGDDMIDGGRGDDVITGGGGLDRIFGGDGNDRISGSSSNEKLNGGAGHDVLIGGAGNDLLAGLDGNDTLLGGAGLDNINGGIGRDRIEGGAGRDLLYGGAGADSFVFRNGDFGGATASLADRIVDFSQAEGDRINLTAVDAIPGGADNPFAFIGAAAFSGAAGQLRYEFVGASTVVSGDTNGDRTADFMIRLDTRIAFATADFVL